VARIPEEMEKTEQAQPEMAPTTTTDPAPAPSTPVETEAGADDADDGASKPKRRGWWLLGR
ncbi:MAG: hypothetical protein AAF982_09925, partial [Pseudomonadota bacterium]